MVVPLFDEWQYRDNYIFICTAPQGLSPNALSEEVYLTQYHIYFIY